MKFRICSFVLPLVPEPQNLNERKIGKKKIEKEERRLSFLPYFVLFIISFFGSILFFGSGTQGSFIFTFIVNVDNVFIVCNILRESSILLSSMRSFFQS